MITFGDKSNRYKIIEVKNSKGDTKPSKIKIQKFGVRDKAEIDCAEVAIFELYDNVNLQKLNKLNAELKGLTDVNEIKKLTDEINSITKFKKGYGLQDLIRRTNAVKQLKRLFGIVEIDGLKANVNIIDSIVEQYAIIYIDEQIEKFNTIVEDDKKN